MAKLKMLVKLCRWLVLTIRETNRFKEQISNKQFGCAVAKCNPVIIEILAECCCVLYKVRNLYFYR